MNQRKSGWLALVLLVSVSLVAAAREVRDTNKKDANPSSSQGSDSGKADGEKKDEAKGEPAKGKDIFAASCQMCHNADSDKANIGPGLKDLFKWPPHKLSDGTEHKEHTVTIIRKQITEGGGTMPPVGAAFSEEEIQDLIAYLQTL